MEKDLFEIFSFYTYNKNSMNVSQYKKLLMDCNIIPGDKIEKIYESFSLKNAMDFNSFKMSLNFIANKNKVNKDSIINKIVIRYPELLKRKEILKRQENLKNKKNLETEEKVKIILEDMCYMGSIMKKEIEQEKKNNPKKFIPIKEAIKENKESTNFCLGILAQELENIGITTAIERERNKSEENIKSSEMVIEFIANGFIDRKKYDFHFDFGEKRNNELLINENEAKKLHQKLKKEISRQKGIKEENILITNPQRGSYIVQVIFLREDFNTEINMSKFKEECNEEEFKELCCLKDIHKQLIMEGCKLTQEMLDSEGNRKEGWEVGGTRGGFEYIPPEGWIGFGLKVTGKYDNGNDDWLAANGNSNEWAVAYHGVGSGINNNLEDVTNKIAKGGLKPGIGQAYKDDDDRFHPGHKIGVGVYCSPNPEVLEEYASQAKSKTKVNEKQYMIGFMLRVKPDKIRSPNEKKDYWVLEGSTDEIRPYRILVKENK